MLEFFDYLPSQNAFKVRALLDQLRIRHVSTFVSIFRGEGRTAEYQRINPTGAVPAIRLPDGRALAESNAILVYLAESSALMPSEAFERAKVMQWLSFEQDYVQNTIGSLRYLTLTGKRARRPRELIEGKAAVAARALDILERELSTRPFICGERYTVADLSLYAYASRAEEAEISLAGHASLRRWARMLDKRYGLDKLMYPYSIDPDSVNELG